MTLRFSRTITRYGSLHSFSVVYALALSWPCLGLVLTMLSSTVQAVKVTFSDRSALTPKAYAHAVGYGPLRNHLRTLLRFIRLREQMKPGCE